MGEQQQSPFGGSITPARRAQKFTTINDVQPNPQPRQVRNPQIISEIKPRHQVPQVHATPQKSVVLNRQAVSDVTDGGKASKSNRRPKRQPLQIAFGAMAMVVLVAGVSVSMLSFQTNKHIQAQVKGVSTTQSNSESGTSDLPSESKPPNIANYKVAPELPKYIKIQKINVNARVKSLGVNSKNELLAPNNIYDAGWYNSSAKPGDSGARGATLIDGHVHGPTTPAVFYRLKSLKAGDEIQIQRGDDKQFVYRVVKVATYDVYSVDMRQAMASAIPGKPGLNIITCGGKYSRASGYSHRTMVFAVQK